MLDVDLIPFPPPLQETMRVYDAAMLKERVHRVGDKIVEAVKKHLWSQQAPPEPSAEEREAYEEWFEDKKRRVSG